MNSGKPLFVITIELPLLAGSSYTQWQKSKFRYPLQSGRSLDVNFNNLKDCFRPILLKNSKLLKR
jgi:hypothetical protein